MIFYHQFDNNYTTKLNFLEFFLKNIKLETKLNLFKTKERKKCNGEKQK